MRHLACLIVCWMITAVGAQAAGLDLDIVSFYGDDTLTYCEVYAGVQREALIYSRLSADSAVARFSLVCSVAQDGSMLRSDTLDTEDSGDTTRVMAGDAYFPYVFRYLLSPGDYQFSVVLLQTEWSERTDFVRDVTIPAIVEESGISDLALGAELAFGANPSAFTRNGVRFVPNPSNFYGSGLPMLYYYAECYGLDTTRPNDSVTVPRMVLADTVAVAADVQAELRSHAVAGQVHDRVRADWRLERRIIGPHPCRTRRHLVGAGHISRDRVCRGQTFAHHIHASIGQVEMTRRCECPVRRDRLGRDFAHQRRRRGAAVGDVVHRERRGQRPFGAGRDERARGCQ